MEPNLEEGERLLISKVVYNLRSPERGDIVVFHPPKKRRVDFIKRIIALPGETIEVKSGVVYVNGRQLDEPYIKESPEYALAKQKIPKDEYFVLGDNRNNSNDSHNGWTVPRQGIVGKAWLLMWPPNKWGGFANYSQLAKATSK
jgi:signal peptidase I